MISWVNNACDSLYVTWKYGNIKGYFLITLVVVNNAEIKWSVSIFYVFMMMFCHAPWTNATKCQCLKESYSGSKSSFDWTDRITDKIVWLLINTGWSEMSSNVKSVVIPMPVSKPLRVTENACVSCRFYCVPRIIKR